MNKKIAWILMIPICVIALYFLLESVMYVPEITGMEGTGLVFFIPIFAIICLGNIVVNIIAGLLGVFSENNELSYKDVFYKKSDKIGVKIIKIIGYLFMLFYMFDMLVGIVNSNYYSIVWNTLAIIVTVFYVIWFSTIKLNWNKTILS